MTSVAASPQLRLLFQQLTWPSAMVRERACDAIARLLADRGCRVEVLEGIYAWTRSQKLESVSILALLAIIRAREKERIAWEISIEDTASSIKAPSPLSWILLRELDRGYSVPVNSSLRHSGDCPPDFSPPSFFTKYVSAFLPPIYEMLAQEVELGEHFNFRQHWAYEWHRIVDSNEIKPSRKPLDFWLGWRSSDHRYHVVDLPMSEVYRSAYLRTLSWAFDTGRLRAGTMIDLASATWPVDLELWRLAPGRTPTWWPFSNEEHGSIDIVGPNIWGSVARLWEEQYRSKAWQQGGVIGSEEIVAAASGRVHYGSVIYELELLGAFQLPRGVRTPHAGEVFRWLRGESSPNAVRYRMYSPVRFAGTLSGTDPNGIAREFGDWSVVPAAGYAHVSSRWQYWRMFRNVWLPAPYLFSERPEFKYADGAVVVAISDRVVASWRDWTDGLTEKGFDDLPPGGGQFLTVRRDLVEKFAASSGARFCWFGRLVGYSREHDYQPYKRFEHFAEFGTGQIILG